MVRLAFGLLVALGIAALGGCGGGTGDGDAGPVVPAPDGHAATVRVGPLLVRPASAAGFVAQGIHSQYGAISLVALHGSRISYLSSQALLDRIVFSRGTHGDHDIWVCNLDGSGAVRLIDNAAIDEFPAWSPDGRRIAFDRKSVGQDAEIVLMNADGSGPHALTDNSFDIDDIHPTWSPDGRRIAFQENSAGDDEVYVMYDDGTGRVNLTNRHDANDAQPDWSPNLSNATIAFVSDRNGDFEIYEMREDGSSQTPITTNLEMDVNPAYDASGSRLAWESSVQGGHDIFIGGPGLAVPYDLSAMPDYEHYPAWSSDGRFVCYASYVDFSAELVLQQTEPPYERFALTDNSVTDTHPDLGSPTMQTDRVIIGPAGSDWGGRNPIWSYSDAGIVAYAADGYRSFVRIAVRAADLPTVSVAPLSAPAGAIGNAPLGVLVEAAEIVNLREDGGRGRSPVLWQLDPLDATAVALYFHWETGKLLAVMTIADQNYPAGAGASRSSLTQRVERGTLVAEGSFAAVFDASGARIADAASAVRIADDTVIVMR